MTSSDIQVRAANIDDLEEVLRLVGECPSPLTAATASPMAALQDICSSRYRLHWSEVIQDPKAQGWLAFEGPPAEGRLVGLMVALDGTRETITGELQSAILDIAVASHVLRVDALKALLQAAGRQGQVRRRALLWAQRRVGMSLAGRRWMKPVPPQFLNTSIGRPDRVPGCR